jgi:zinc resistance-associated protein
MERRIPMKINKTSIFGLAAVLTLAIATLAFAHGGWGYESHMGGYGNHMMGPGYDGGHMMGRGYGGDHMMNYDCDHDRYMHWREAWNNLSDADAAKLEAFQEKFYKDTHELRDKIDEKEFALRKELNKSNPNQHNVLALQKELSSLHSDFDQKALAHQLEVRKLLPEDYRGSGYGHGPAYCR